MNSEIKITIIIPAYNVAAWLPRCIDSVLEQTHTNLEVLVIDDGSTDDTPAILEEYAKKDKRIITVHQENAGLIAVRERGISMATGQYVGFIDGDDEVESDMYERLLNNALKYDADISQCGILYCFYDGRKKAMHGTGRVQVYDRMEGYRELLRGTCMEPSLCNKIYSRVLLQDSCPDMTIINNEDLLRNSVLFSRAKCSVLEDFCGYHYWRRAESMSNNDRVVQVGINILKARKLILENAEHDVWYDALGCYVTALISTYNSLIGCKESEAAELRQKCITILKEQRGQLTHLSKGRRYRAEAIIKCPGIYDIAHKIHMKLLYAKIRRAAKATK